MLINLVGFEWTANQHVTIGDLCQHIISKNKQPIKLFGYNRVLFAKRTGGRLVGVFLTIKDQKSITSIDVKSYILSIQRLRAGTQLADFNFFAVNESSGKGLYSHYHNSTGITVFNEFMRRQFAELSELRKNAACQGLKKSKADQAKRRAESQKYSQELGTTQMVRQEQLPQLLAQLKRIRSFEFDATTILARASWFRPMAGEATARCIKIRFKSQASIGTLADQIVDLVTGQQITAGRIEGEGDDKVRQIIDLVETPDSFGHYEFDDVVKEGMINYEHVEKSPFLGTIESVLTNNDACFGTTS